MCFGNTNTGTQTTTPTPNPALAGAAAQNLGALENLQNTGYTPYTGQRVADLTSLQNQAFGVAGATPNTNPYAPTAASDINSYANAPGQTVTASSIASQMSPYMNQYVAQALAPQIQGQNQQFAQQNQQLNAAMTDAGAFGDSRAGIEAANLTNQQNTARTGLLGQAYSNAFNTAIGAGAQDVANSMQAQQATGGFTEQALARQLGGANALTGLGSSNQAYAQNQANLLQQQGGIQQAQHQAQLNVPYSNYLAAQQYPFLTSQAMNQGIQSAAYGMPASTTTTISQPNNAGWSLAGALAPSLFNGGTGGFGSSALGQGASWLGNTALPWLLSDKREKENIKKVGDLDDGTPVKTFNFKRDPAKRPQLGVVAQDVEKTNPAAVKMIGGRKYVDMDRLTRMDSAMGMAA